MNQTVKQPVLGRSVWAIVAGFLVVVVLSFATDTILRVAAILPTIGQRMSDTLFVLATAYRTAFGIIGSYATARLAPNSPMKHAMIGAAIGFVLATAGAVATWTKDVGPHWYPIALLLGAFPTAWLGAKARIAQMH